MSIYDEDSWQVDGIMESQQPSEAEEANEGSVISIRQSSRLASKNPNIPSIEDWPVPKLLEVLFKNDITAPVGASHEELFALFKENIRSKTASTFLSNYTVPKKSAEKRKNCSQNSAAVPTPAAAPPSKRARAPDEAASSAYPADNDPMVSALNNIQMPLF